jgi:hypothetical protein
VTCRSPTPKRGRSLYRSMIDSSLSGYRLIAVDYRFDNQRRHVRRYAVTQREWSSRQRRSDRADPGNPLVDHRCADNVDVHEGQADDAGKYADNH